MFQTKAEQRRTRKQRRREEDAAASRARVFVLDFQGDVEASAAEALREEVSGILVAARDNDEVVVRLESAGGVVHGYGFAASQLARIKARQLRLIVAVDKVAASGGYLMACVADELLAGPFALLGSIGVLVEMPNVHRLLKKHDVDVEILTAGEHKRTLTLLGQNTDQGRAKLMEELEDVHLLFKEFVGEHRPRLELDKVATGEAWYGKRALTLHLVDALMTSDEYLQSKLASSELLSVSWVAHRKGVEGLLERLGGAAFRRVFSRRRLRWIARLLQRVLRR
jgi:serine protease SohB